MVLFQELDFQMQLLVETVVNRIDNAVCNSCIPMNFKVTLVKVQAILE